MKMQHTIRKTGPIWPESSANVAPRKLAEALKKAGDVLHPAIKGNARVATGKMRGGVKLLISQSGLVVRVVSELGQEYYSIPVESGTKQGKVAIEPLVRWVEAKLGKSGVKAVQTAFAIATVKAREGGTEKTNWFYGPWDRMRPTINALYLGPVGAAIVQELES